MSDTHNTGTSPTSVADDEIDLGRLLGLLIDHKWWILGITALFSLGGIAYALQATPVYQGDALVQVEQRTASPLGELGEMLGQETDANTQAQVQILQSRMVLGEVVDRVGLDTVVQPTSLPLIGDLLRRQGVERPEFFEDSATVWAGESLTLGRLEMDEFLRGDPLKLRVTADGFALWHDDEHLADGRVGQTLSLLDGALTLRVASLQAAPGAEFTLIKLTNAQAIQQLKSRLTVTEVGGGGNSGSGMLTLTLTGSDRGEIQRSLDALAETFLTQNVERQSAEAEQSLSFLQEQAPELRTQLANAENRLNEYRVDMDSVDLSSEAQAVIDQYIDIERRLSELEYQEAELAQRFTSSHPNYQALLRQKRHLQQERDELNQRVNELPAAQQQVVRLTRDVEVTQAIYVNVLNKIQELQVARAGTVGNVRIIDEALVGQSPIEPKKPLIVVLATLLGGMLATGGVLVRGLLNRGLESPEQIEELGLPVYATVPLSEEQSKLVKRRVKHRRDRHARLVTTGVLAQVSPADTSIEALRGLRTSLHFAMLEATDNLISITGPSPGIGKSFISINLAAVCAQSGQRVLIVDADMRKGHVHHTFGTPAEGGLSEILTGKQALEAGLRHSEIEGMDYVTRGSAPPNPSELLMHQRFSDFLAEVSKRYDLVIIDTPPILAVTDAAVVAKQCGTTLMVVRFQVNPAKELQVAMRRMETSGITARGAILNAMERKAATSYGYYNYAYK